MRLTCPNCGAQYEVPDEVIPATGRDVQCSNCGETWFKHHPDHQPEEDGDGAQTQHPDWDSPEEDADVASDDGKRELEGEASSEGEPGSITEPEPELDEAAGDDAPEVDEYSAEDLTEPEPAPEFEDDEAPQRRGLDPSIADVLREEAAREQQARASEGSGGLETQPDLGLDGDADETGEIAQQTKSRMARLRGLSEDSFDDSDEPEPDPGLISRRNLLPDIDEINSSLDSESTRAEMDHAGADMSGAGTARQKSGFNRGFMRVVLLVLILVLLYLLGPMIAEKVPALAGIVSGFVDTVNAGRLWLNDMIGMLLAPQ